MLNSYRLVGKSIAREWGAVSEHRFNGVLIDDLFLEPSSKEGGVVAELNIRQGWNDSNRAIRVWIDELCSSLRAYESVTM